MTLSADDDIVVAHNDLGAIARLHGRLVDTGGNVLITSANPAALERFGRVFMQELRKHPAAAQCQISVLFDLDRELMLARFNERISSLSLDQARGAAAADSSSHVWVLLAQSDEQVAQALLLARLTGDFPAAKVRLVVLASMAVEQALSGSVEGRRMLRCVVQPAEPNSAFEQHRSGPIALDSELGARATEEVAASASGAKLGGASQPGRSRRTGRLSLPVIAVGGGLLAVSVLVVFILQPAPFLSLLSREAPPVKSRAEPEPLPAGTLPEPPQPALALPGSQKVEARGAVPDARAPSSQPDGPAISAPGPTTQASTGSVPLPVAEADAVPRVPAPEVTPAEPARVSAPSAPAISRAAPSPRGVEWARGLSRTQWVVQHVALPTLGDAVAWQTDHPQIVGTKIVMLARRGSKQRYFVVVSGPFADRDAANRLNQDGQGAAAQVWVRSAVSLQAALPAADAQP